MRNALVTLGFLVFPGCYGFGGEGSPSYHLSCCKSNLKNIATACELYANDYHGMYPSSLSKLVETNQLRQIPTCPAAGKDTYSASYKFTVAERDKKGVPVRGLDSFSFVCRGEFHSNAGKAASLPAYDSQVGLKEK